MYVNGKKVVGVAMVRDHGDLKNVTIDCIACGDPYSSAVRVSFDSSWDDVEEVAVCADCLVEDGWFGCYEDIK